MTKGSIRLFIKIRETRNVKRGREMDVLSRDISRTRNFNLSNVCFVTWILPRVLHYGFQACQVDDRCEIVSATLEITPEGGEHSWSGPGRI